MFSKDGIRDDSDLTLYGGEDPRRLPLYTYRDAARATDVPATTIASWFRGQRYVRRHDVGFFSPVLKRPDRRDYRLCFDNLLQIWVVRALRTGRIGQEVKLDTIREAIRLAERHHGITDLLLSSQLRANFGRLFLDSYFELVELSQSEQLVIRDVLKDSLKRIHFEETKGVFEFFPLPRAPENRNREIIVLSPFIAFGQPIIRSVGVSTAAIAGRYNAGEAQAAILEDYDLAEDEFLEAIRYEAAA